MEFDGFVRYARRRLGKYFKRVEVEKWNGDRYVIVIVDKNIPEKFGNAVYNELVKYVPRGYQFAMLVE